MRVPLATIAVMHVMAGVLRDDEGRVLLAQRPAGKHLAGMWEFPGGKIEPGETPRAALARELEEEIGIKLRQATPLIEVSHQTAAGRALVLDAWVVDQWDGEPRSLEGQALQWLLPTQIDPAILTPADCPILHILLNAAAPSV